MHSRKNGTVVIQKLINGFALLDQSILLVDPHYTHSPQQCVYAVFVTIHGQTLTHIFRLGPDLGSTLPPAPLSVVLIAACCILQTCRYRHCSSTVKIMHENYNYNYYRVYAKVLLYIFTGVLSCTPEINVYNQSVQCIPAATIIYKRLASLISEKQGRPYSSTLHWVRCRLNFSLLRSAVMCIRGSRSTFAARSIVLTWPSTKARCNLFNSTVKR